VRVRFDMPNKIGGPIEQENGVGEIRGYEKPDEIVHYRSHQGSWEWEGGARNGLTTPALVISKPRENQSHRPLAEADDPLSALHGEEQGTIGSYEYVKAHRAELDLKISSG